VWKSSDLQPETSVSYNLSADYYGKSSRTAINLFHTRLNDKIGFTNADPDVSALGYDYQWRNIDDAYVQGIEFTFVTNLTRKLDLGIDITYNHGEYKNAREDWIGTEYEDISKNISRFPVTTGNLKVEYRPGTWTLALYGNYQGNMYIDYYNEDIDPEVGDLTKIKKTDPYVLFNTKISKQLRQFRLYAGVNNIFNYLQNERHLDDPAFMYAPVYGTMGYAGASITLGK
jgi:outer membrane receptor for ferrienterochelin and colicins